MFPSTQPHAARSSFAGLRRWAILPAIGGMLLLGLGMGTPAAAQPDPGPAIPSTAPQANCPLTRVGRQLTRCDYLTGAEIPAPLWIPEQTTQLLPPGCLSALETLAKELDCLTMARCGPEILLGAFDARLQRDCGTN